MRFYEYEAKALFARHGVPLLKGRVETLREALRQRLSRLPAATRKILLVASALGFISVIVSAAIVWARMGGSTPEPPPPASDRGES